MNRFFKSAEIQPLLIFLGLFGMGITLPILDLYGQNPEIFTTNRSTSAQIVAFALIVALLPTGAMGIIWWLSRAMNHRAGYITQVIGISIAGFFVFSSLLRFVMESTNLSLAIAIPASIFLGIYGRHQGIVRDWLSFLVFVPVVSLVSFLGYSDSAGLLWQEDAEAEEEARIANPVPVVFLVLDELPLMSLLRENGQINDSLFPNFARVAESSYWFRNFATNSVKTADSIPIMLSGVIKEDAKPTSADYPNTLFTLLGERYAMNVRESVTSLCPGSICRATRNKIPVTQKLKRTDGSLQLLLVDAVIVYGHVAMPPLVRNRLPGIGGRWGGFLGQREASEAPEDRVSVVKLPPVPKGGRPRWVNDFLAAMDRLATSWTPSLHYTHLMTPHIPWRVNPSGTVYRAPDFNLTTVAGLKGGYWPKTTAMPTQGLQRHLAQVGAVDKLLGYYVDELQRTGLWNEALVIITSDHGASFKAGSHRRDVMGDNAEALYRVPLFIHLPGQDSTVVMDEAAFSIDILPTIIDVLDVSVDWPLIGLSLLGELPETRSHVYDHFTGTRVALDMHLEGLMSELAHNYGLVPDTNSWESIAAVGPHRELVGKSLTELGAIGDESIFVVFDWPEDVLTIDEHSEVPTFLRGRVSMPHGFESSDILIAVNGTVAGAGTTLTDNRETSAFYGYVPESAFRNGRNTVELVIASETGDWHHSVSVSAISESSGPKFANPLLSPVFPGPGDGLKVPTFHPANGAPPANWLESRLSTDGKSLYLQPSPREISFAARYVYIPLTVDNACDEKMLIGSDDTLEVWFEGEKILEHKSSRRARLGDNQALLRLQPGANHLYLRVDNRGGAWRLITKLNSCLSSGSEVAENGGSGIASAYLSPVFPYPDEGFKSPPFNPSNSAPPADWLETRISSDGQLDLNLRPSPRAVRYIYVPIHAEEMWNVEVLVRSDDVQEAWFEGERIPKHGLHSLQLGLRPGVSHLYFQVDHRQEAWRFNAKMNPQQIP